MPGTTQGFAAYTEISATQERLRVDLGNRSYEIVTGGGLLQSAGQEICEALGVAALKPGRLAVITDETVADHHMSALLKGLGLGENEDSVPRVIVAPGESSKSFATLEQLTETLLGYGIERGTTIIAFGGGVVGDLAGFAASVLLRGVNFVQIPTTLLAMVDSSVGGKTGINTKNGKNLVGAFHQPKLVLADTDTLATLSRREMLAGYAEVVKYGLLGDADFFSWLEANGRALVDGDTALLRHAIVRCCAAKARIVAADEREAGQRALLNLGHTFGHALEAEAGMSGALLHGEAVAVGMVMAFDFSVRQGLCAGEDAARARRVLSESGLPVSLSDLGAMGLAVDSWTPERLIAHMAKDKKVQDGRMTFILVRAIGDSFVTQDVSAQDLHAFLAQGAN